MQSRGRINRSSFHVFQLKLDWNEYVRYFRKLLVYHIIQLFHQWKYSSVRAHKVRFISCKKKSIHSSAFVGCSYCLYVYVIDKLIRLVSETWCNKKSEPCWPKKWTHRTRRSPTLALLIELIYHYYWVVMLLVCSIPFQFIYL